MAVSKADKKEAFTQRLIDNVQKYKSCFVVNIDNVGSTQMHQIRRALREQGAAAMMGKNTMIRRAVGLVKESNPEAQVLGEKMRGNVGMVFTNGDLKTVRDIIIGNRVRAPARQGAIAPIDVIVPAGNTGLDPSKAQFFLALGIPRKINRGTVEITQDVHLIKPGDRVGPSEAELLNMLNISPFTYGMTVTHVYDEGSIFSPAVLDTSEEDVLRMLSEGISDIAAVSLATGYTTKASVPHQLINGYKDLIAISVASDYTFEGSKEIKEFLENPEAFASVMAAAAPAATTGSAPAADKKVEEEEEEESEEEIGNLFGDEDGF